MREIKFRAWHKEQHKMGFFDLDEIWYDVDIKFDSPEGLSTWDKPTGDGYYAFTFNDMKDVVIMQYTGLTDKDGNEIYEGDIVKLTFTFPNRDNEKESRIVSVEWNQYHGGFCFSTSPSVWMFSGEQVEVIGNIYANPDMI